MGTVRGAYNKEGKMWVVCAQVLAMVDILSVLFAILRRLIEELGERGQIKFYYEKPLQEMTTKKA